MRIPSVAAIVLTYNGFNLTKTCLKALSQVNYPNRTIFLIDNCSEQKDEVTRLRTLSNYYDCLLEIPQENRGFAGGMNYGAQHALDSGEFEYVLFLSNDVILAEDALDRLVEAMEEDTDIGIAGPLQYYYRGGKAPDKIYSAGATITRITNKPAHITSLANEAALDYLVGSAFLVRKACFLQMNGFDESYYIWYEDCDLCARAMKSGWKLALARDSVIWHKVAQTLGGKSKESMLHSAYYHSRNRVMFARKNRTSAEYVVFLLYLLAWDAPMYVAKQAYMASRRKETAVRFCLKAIRTYYKGIWDGLRRN